MIRGFIADSSDVKPIIFIVLMITLVLKLIVVYMLDFGGKKYKNNSLLVSAKESFVDLIATLVVLVVCLMLLFEDNVYLFRYADVFGSVMISGIMFYTAFNIVRVNINYLLGTNEENVDIRIKINNIIVDNKIIKDSSFKLIKIGDYYALYLTLELDDSITLRKIMLLENLLKKKIKNSIREIKYIQIEIKEFKELKNYEK